MKVAVSIPDDVYHGAEALAARYKMPRSRLYARALSQFIAGHEQDDLTASINAALEAIGNEPDDCADFVREAARQTFARTEWS